MTIDNAVLRSEIDLVRHGVGDADSLMGALRRSVLLVPQPPAPPGAEGVAQENRSTVLSGDQDGLRWIYAFTSPEELAGYFVARGEGDQEVPYLTVRGDRLLDVAVPALGVPGGIAVDVAGEAPMLFPAVEGAVGRVEGQDA